MFYDWAKIQLKAGDGGNGVVSFRREKYVPYGGPNGGDGGRGGNIILEVDEGMSTLADFRYRSHYKALRGEHGQGKDKHGRDAKELILKVPSGTVVRNSATGEIIADLVHKGQRTVIAAGGRGGRGNARFASSKNRIPKVCEKGEPGEELWVELELKVLADVGLVGFPNAGKSTLIAAMSGARPKIADYPFTTLTPNLGVVTAGDSNYVIADVPGLISGAHEGAGLGHRFLRHIERTRILAFILDAGEPEGLTMQTAYDSLKNELGLFDESLLKRPRLIVANKMDLPQSSDNLERFKGQLAEETEIFAVSAAAGAGVRDLANYLAARLAALPKEIAARQDEYRVTRYRPEKRFEVTCQDGIFEVSGKEVEKHLAMTDLENEAAVQRFQRILQMMGVDDALRKLGAKNGDTVLINDVEFDFED